MKINKRKYWLSEFNYIKTETSKNKIILSNTLTPNLSHIAGFSKRYNGRYTKAPMFTIDMDGTVFQHYNTKYYTHFLGIEEVDVTSITISLVNQGCLIKINDDIFVDYLGREYNGIPHQQYWRNKKYWAKYDDRQIESLKELCLYLLEKNKDINRSVAMTNTKQDVNGDSSGIFYRSNLIKEFTDLSPAFDYIKFKETIEMKKEKRKPNLNVISEFDITRKMLKTIRENQTPNEEVENNEPKLLSGAEEEAQKEKFRTTITPRVEFNQFLLYPQTNDAKWGGKFLETGLEWEFSLGQSDGIFIKTEVLQLTDKVIDNLNKLSGYYKNWADEWANNLATEYKN